MKIIKEGKLKLEFKYNYQSKCDRCDCKFDFLIEDIHESSNGTEEKFIRCPWCASKISIGNLNDYFKTNENYDDFMYVYCEKRKILPNYYSQINEIFETNIEENN